ncbi:phosphohydrolase [bacterium (Candidatus Torokbacteria) CG_4_10_14_0_2_um_filter_35_8]|nr:MAG: phosphohydrolase [bacterium (Candidatus Torokbacteria) CG_4_10_14_0_2_um_filter_35_8]
MNREQALKLIKQKIKNKNLIKHMLAVEACLRDLAKYLGEDVEAWGLSGLLHDLDYEETVDNPKKHGVLSGKELKKLGISDEIIHAVKAHNEATGTKRVSKLDKAIYTVDPVTGLIVACALVMPDKKLASLSVESIMKKYKSKNFAAGANREIIASCKEFGMELEEFIESCLKSMQGISEELEL